MKMVLKKITMHDFKGIKDLEVEFGKSTKIAAENGLGKTTIADAFYWLISNKSVDLVENPNIRPNTEENDECLPTVIADIEVDGKPITIQKAQKKKIGKPDDNGVSKLSLTNSYEVNSVPKSEKDYKAYLEEAGIDVDKLLMLSHADAFINQMNDKKGRESMRSTLFGMVSNVTDLEVAEKTDNVDEVVELLKNYKMDEIEAMQKSTMTKIRENYGKDGEILTAKIQGLESAKVDVDVAELELSKNSITKQILDVEESISVMKDNSKVEELKEQKMKLDFEINDVKRTAYDEIHSARTKIEQEMNILNKSVVDIQSKLGKNSFSTQNLQAKLLNEKNMFKVSEDTYKEWKDKTLSDDSKVCPTCKQVLPENEVKKIIDDFEKEKKQTIDNAIADGKALKSSIQKLEKELDSLSSDKKSLEDELDKLNSQIDKLSTEIEKLPTEPNMNDNKAFNDLVSKKESIESQIEELLSNKPDTSSLETEKSNLQNQLHEVEEKITLSNRNIEIDEQISKMNDDRRNYEQQKANCEKILYQLDLVRKTKNEILSNEVNSHFKLVDFKLFTYMKNGSYQECCIPMIDGKDFNTESNGALKTLAKLDIVDGLQRFYGQELPIIVDNFESVSEKTASRIDIGSQLITLCVSEDKELKVEV